MYVSKTVLFWQADSGAK